MLAGGSDSTLFIQIFASEFRLGLIHTILFEKQYFQTKYHGVDSVYIRICTKRVGAVCASSQLRKPRASRPDCALANITEQLKSLIEAIGRSIAFEASRNDCNSLMGQSLLRCYQVVAGWNAKMTFIATFQPIYCRSS